MARDDQESRERIANDVREREAQEDVREESTEEVVEDRGGKQNNGRKHANQYTKGRNDDRGRKE